MERQQLMGEAERVRQQRLKIQQEEQAMLDEARRKRLEIQQQLSRERCDPLFLTTKLVPNQPPYLCFST